MSTWNVYGTSTATSSTTSYYLESDYFLRCMDTTRKRLEESIEKRKYKAKVEQKEYMFDPDKLVI